MTDTPIHALMRFEKAEIFLKREDFLPFSFGGNKVRIAAELFRALRAAGCNAVVSYGSPTSNLNRVVAQMALREGLPCTIVCKEESGETKDSGQQIEGSGLSQTKSVKKPLNLILVEQTGARIVSCRADQVAAAIEAVLSDYRSEGFKPYYVYGHSDGHGNEAVLLSAYETAYREILAYEEASGISFDTIFLPCGTGMTQAGLLLGQAIAGGRHEICGISVARGKAAAEEGVREKLYATRENAGTGDRLILKDGRPTQMALPAQEIFVTDAYLAGGYGGRSGEIDACIAGMTRRYGLPLDPVYTGKAFYGMLKEIRRRELSGNILFLHTGGLPIYFDEVAAHMLQ